MRLFAQKTMMNRALLFFLALVFLLSVLPFARAVGSEVAPSTEEEVLGGDLPLADPSWIDENTPPPVDPTPAGEDDQDGETEDESDEDADEAETETGTEVGSETETGSGTVDGDDSSEEDSLDGEEELEEVEIALTTLPLAGLQATGNIALYIRLIDAKGRVIESVSGPLPGFEIRFAYEAPPTPDFDEQGEVTYLPGETHALQCCIQPNVASYYSDMSVGRYTLTPGYVPAGFALKTITVVDGEEGTDTVSFTLNENEMVGVYLTYEAIPLSGMSAVVSCQF